MAGGSGFRVFNRLQRYSTVYKNPCVSELGLSCTLACEGIHGRESLEIYHAGKRARGFGSNIERVVRESNSIVQLAGDFLFSNFSDKFH